MYNNIPQIGATIVIDGRTFVRQNENPTFADIVKNPQQWADTIKAEYAPWDDLGKYNRAADMVREALDAECDLRYLEANKDAIIVVTAAMRGGSYAHDRAMQLIRDAAAGVILAARAGREMDPSSHKPERAFWRSVEEATFALAAN